MELPKIKDSPLIYVLGGSLGTAVFLAAGLIIYSLPGASPITVVETRAFWTDAGRWRVESELRVTDACRVEVNRRFTRDGPLQREPAASYLGLRIGELPYLVQTTPGNGVAWYEYAIAPGEFQEYLIEATAWQCDNGFEGNVARQIVPVGLPGKGVNR